ncbi:4-hydroxyphenylacetate 3-hydroxylase N-terminal domain-containing protein, partial [Trebonia sp.]|uniref:4-hydroxyphenylacetate 3-hydroxylase N-terminal domain-containing protein n=1 Tax=Trebonia sp. TaxID=2767075 RepID=UPI00261E75FA
MTVTDPQNTGRAQAAAASGGTPAATRPMTGDEYIESIRDGREVYIYGDRVRDVTTHPAFRNPVRMTARLYDSMRDPKLH